MQPIPGSTSEGVQGKNQSVVYRNIEITNCVPLWGMTPKIRVVRLQK